MKTIFDKQKRSVVGLLIAVMAFTAALTGCQKDFELELPLGGLGAGVVADQGCRIDPRTGLFDR